jgi:phosphoglycolate phosphatase-like HAD superfamily hydrolase
MTRLILFDIDGTLLSARGAPRRAFGRAMTAVYGTAGPVDNHPFDGKTDPQIARELLHLAGLEDEVVDARFPALWSTYLRELTGELERPDHETVVYPGVRELLGELEGRDGAVVIGLLTGNIEAGAALKLASARVTTQFRVGAFGSDCERRDGLPAIAVERARALTGMEFRGHDVVVIGDTPNDVTCGRALGVRAIGVGTGRHDPEELLSAGAYAAFADLGDTAAVIDALFGRDGAGG